VEGQLKRRSYFKKKVGKEKCIRACFMEQPDAQQQKHIGIAYVCI